MISRNRYKAMIPKANHTLPLIAIKTVWAFFNVETMNKPMFQNGKKIFTFSGEC